MQASERLVAAGDFVDAVRRGEWDRADDARHALGAMLPDECLTALAELHMHRERWSDAATTIGHLKHPTPAHKLQFTLAKNLDALRAHRPTVYRVVADAEIGDAYQIHPSKSGLPSIVAMRPDRSRVLLAGGPDPRAAADQVCASLAPAFQRGTPLAVLSIGDGYVFNALTRHSPTLQLGRRQAIFLFEPDPRLLFACMLLHDLTGPGGPIESQNVLWYVGPKWAEQFRIDILIDRYLPFPQTTIKLGHDARPMEEALQSALGELGASDTRSAQVVRSHYTPLTASDFATVLAGHAGRAPRVLLITTRFSTVLQHSTRDTADAFRQLGWEAHVLIEPTSHHGLSRAGMRRTLAEFKPDLIFQIDHNRFEHSDVIPPNIPFVNWIQDLLPHLMTPETGRQLTARDFVLTPSLQRWVDEYAYPAHQCMEFRKLTRIPSRPTSWSSRSDQLVYVSNWSQSPGTIREELIRGSTGQTREVIDETCMRMIACYESGQSLRTQGDVRRVLLEVMRDQQVSADESLVRHTTARLFDRLNNLLFRQQGLRWAKRACQTLDLNLEIYGTGWDKHPEFVDHARGSVSYGDELEELTRNAGINLVLEPFVCVSHQRFLDAVAAGGFCLVRDNPANHNIHSIIELLAAAGKAVENAVQLLEALPDSHREQFDQTLIACDAVDASPGASDHVAIVRALQSCNVLPQSGLMIPMLDRTTFSCEDEMLQRLTRFTRDECLRSEIARVQRQHVEDRFSYAAGMRQVVAFVRTRLTAEANRLGQAA